MIVLISAANLLRDRERTLQSKCFSVNKE